MNTIHLSIDKPAPVPQFPAYSDETLCLHLLAAAVQTLADCTSENARECHAAVCVLRRWATAAGLSRIREAWNLGPGTRSPTANAEFEAALGRLWRLPANELRSQAARLRYYQESGQPPQQLNTNLVRVLKVAAAIEAQRG